MISDKQYEHQQRVKILHYIYYVTGQHQNNERLFYAILLHGFATCNFRSNRTPNLWYCLRLG